MFPIWEDMEQSFRYADFETSMRGPTRDVKEVNVKNVASKLPWWSSV